MRRAAVVLASAAGLAGAPAHANPTGPVVVSGQAAFAQQGGTLSVTNTPGTIINWQQFSIRPNETTRFIQQSATSAVLNRVVGGDPSMLLGTLQSNGRVFLINPSGILFGAGAQVSVAGLVASSLQLSNQDFLAGRLNFTGDPTQSAPVVNRGRIAADGGGQVVLVGAAVANKGVITAPNGDIVLAAGRSVRVTEVGAPEIQVEITAPADRPLNLSEVTSGGRGIYSGFVTNSGSLNANSAVVNAGGRVVLKASNGVQLAAGSTVSADGNAGGSVMVDAQQGAATVAGMISARGTDAAGGTVAVTGNSVALSGIAQIDASGASAGGSVMIGGDLHGAPINDGGTALGNSRITSVAPGAQIRADATAAGDGGKVVVWSDATTTFRGSISARGGAASGNGGTVEVSGKQSLTFHGSVDTRAPAGKTGTLLLDPANIVIQAGSSDGDDADGLGNSFAGSPSGTTGSVLAGDTTPTALFQSELEGIAATTNISLAATNSITINPLAGGNLNLAQTAGRSVSFQSGTFSMSGSDTITTAGGALAITTTSGGATIGSLAANGGAVTLDVAGASTVAGGISGTGTTLTKLGAGALTLQGISTYTGATTVSAGTLQLGTSNALANSGALIVNGGTFDIGANSQTLAGAQLASGSITGTSGTLTSTANFDLRSGTVSAILGGNVSVNKTTGGTVTLSGNNTYTGATNVNAGTLAVAANNALGTTAAGTTVANGATLDFQSVVYGTTETVAVNGGTIAASTGSSSFAGPITLGASSSATVAGTQLTLSGAIGDGGGGFGLTMTGTGKLVLGTTNTYTGTTNVNAGTLALGTSNSLASAGSLVVNGGTFDIGGLDQTFAGVQLASGAITGTTGTLTSNSNFDLRAGTASAILGGSVGLDKTTGGTATLSGNNTYSGATNVNAGTLAAGANNALGTTGAGTTVASGATLDFQNVAYGSAEPVTVNGGSLATSAGTSSFAGPVTLGTSSSVSVTGTQLTLSGVIGQSSGGLGLTKTGAGKLVLGATEAYTGNTTVSGGTLSLGASDLLVNTTSLVVSGGTFDIGANNQTFAGVQLASGSITGTSGTLTSNSNFDLRQGTASAILAGSAGVDKTTTGTVTLSGNNTYSGTTNVNAGTLSAAANNALGTTGAGTTVANGATLDFASVAYTST
ncbi:MAG TPA: autotransporter-associated beta strand repeat-containing protein, partial [Burkholderiales bacterium]|nr:autotransporter-associated beta strand repeat-containing protein [Burkholderiales bacterium]